MTVAISGFGTKFNWNAVDIAEGTNITGPSESADMIDVTSHDSPNAYREFVAGLRNGGDISIEGNFIKGDTAGQIAMHADLQSGAKRAWIIKFPGWAAGAPQISGFGFVTAFDPTFPYEDKIGFSATVKVTGIPTLTPA